MLLTVDMGNTTVTLGVFNGDTPSPLGRISTELHRTADQYAVDIKNWFDISNIPISDVTDCILSSVVPTLTDTVARAVSKAVGVEPLIVGPGVKTGLNIKIDNPAQLGSDLVAAAVAAKEKYPLPCVIYQLGTANTASVLDSDGSFLGVSISPGLSISLGALVSKTSQLPYVALDGKVSLLGKNTVDSMKSGLIIGAASTLDGFKRRIEKELGQKVFAVATGGKAHNVLPFCEEDIVSDESLLQYGLKLIYEKNQNQ